MRFALIVSFALTLTVAAHAQEVAQGTALTLDNALELGLRNRALIIRTQGAEQLARAERRAALGAFLPNLSASYNWSRSKSRDQKQDVIDSLGNIIEDVPQEDQDGRNQSLSIDASMSLLDVSNFFNYSAARLNAERARLDVIASEQDLIYAVKISYYDYLASVENITVQEEAVRRAEEQLKLIQSRFDLGSASLSDVLKQKVLFGNDRLALLRARNAVTNSKANLAYTIGADPRQEWNFSTNFTSREYEGTLQEAIDFGLQHRPALLAAEKGLAVASKDLAAARSQYLPTVGGFASYDISSGSAGFVQLFDRSGNTFSYGFQVRWNIFDGFLRERNTTAAKVFRNNAEAELADTRNLTVTEIRTAYSDIEQLKEQVSVAQENVTAATEDLKITQEKYNLGAATILDLLDAQVSLKQAQVGLIQAEFDFNLAVSKLENAMGKM